MVISVTNSLETPVLFSFELELFSTFLTLLSSLAFWGLGSSFFSSFFSSPLLPPVCVSDCDLPGDSFFPLPPLLPLSFPFGVPFEPFSSSFLGVPPLPGLLLLGQSLLP